MCSLIAKNNCSAVFRRSCFVSSNAFSIKALAFFDSGLPRGEGASAIWVILRVEWMMGD